MNMNHESNRAEMIEHRKQIETPRTWFRCAVGEKKQNGPSGRKGDDPRSMIETEKIARYPINSSPPKTKKRKYMPPSPSRRWIIACAVADAAGKTIVSGRISRRIRAGMRRKVMKVRDRAYATSKNAIMPIVRTNTAVLMMKMMSIVVLSTWRSEKEPM
jgi:hypothetical protein